MKTLKEIFLINLGLFLVAFGIYMFKIPNNFVTGGVSGLAIITGHFVPGLSVGPIMMIINLILLLAGFLFVGSNFASKTIYSSFALSGMVWVLEKVFPVSSSITGDTFLELVYSIILPAVGSAIVFNQNASTGGTDIVAKILSKLTHVNIGKTLLMADLSIAAAAMFVFGARVGMYSILGLVMKGFLIDFVIEGLNLGKQVVIITNKSKAITEFIVNELKRGATITKAAGAYTNEEKDVITTVVNRGQAIKLRIFVKQTDDKAFMTISNTSEIIGKGFRNADI